MTSYVETSDAPQGANALYLLQAGDAFSGTLNNQFDTDVWDVLALNLRADESYFLEDVLPGFRFWALDDANGNQLINGTPSGSPIDFSVSETGTYYLWLEGAYGGLNDYGFTLTAEEAAATTTQAIAAPGTSYTGTLDHDDDADWIAIDAEAGQTYVIEYLSDGERPVLDILDASGADLSSAESSVTGDTFVWFTPQTSGRYYAQVFDRFSFTGSYEIRVATEVADNAQTQAQISMDYSRSILGSYAGEADYVQDTDWVAVQLTAGLSYRITQSHDIENKMIRLRSADGTIVHSSDIGADSEYRFDFTPTEDGIYFVESNYAVNQNTPWYFEDPEFYSITVELAPNSAERSFATLAADILTYTVADRALYALAGDDSVTGGDAADRFYGNSGDDTLSGLGGDDFLVGNAGNDRILGGAGDDRIYAGADDQGDDWANGGSGNDVIAGGAGDDTLYGGTGRDTLFGGAGDDQLHAEGPEGVTSGQTDDIIWAGEGSDSIVGNAGDNVLGGGAGNDTINGLDGDDTIYGGSDSGDDSLHAGSGNDVVFSGGGNDTIWGGDGSDTIYNGAGDDNAHGGNGDDDLWGGAGNDSLEGGSGADVFAFAENNGNDTVTDFSFTDGDQLDLEGIGISDEAAALALMSNEADGVLLEAAGTSILILATTTADFAAASDWMV